MPNLWASTNHQRYTVMILFDTAKDRTFKGEIDLPNATLKLLLKSGVAADLTVADTLADIPVGERVAIADQPGAALVAGVNPGELYFTADDVVVPAVSGPQINQLIMYIEGPSEALSPLFAARNVVFIPSGLNISIEWGSYVFRQDCPGGNQFYFEAKRQLFSAGTDFLGDDIHAILIDSAYAFDFSDLTLADIAVGARVGDVEGYPLVGKLVGADDGLQPGVFDANDIVIPLLSGDDIEAIALIKFDVGTPEDSPLIAYLNEGMNFPLTPDGTTAGIVFSNLAQRILNI